MKADAQLNCFHCNRLFVPDCRHRRDQRCCSRPACKRARQAASLQRWRAKPENRDFWRGAWNVERVREWRAAHPGYWKRASERDKAPLQNAMKLPGIADPAWDKASFDGECATKRIPGLLREQSPVVVGLIAQMTGCTLQNAILEVTEKLFEKGRAVIGP